MAQRCIGVEPLSCRIIVATQVRAPFSSNHWSEESRQVTRSPGQKSTVRFQRTKRGV